MANGDKVRVVRCPRCDNLLPEPSEISVYQCGGCGAVLRAKKKVPTDVVDKVFDKKHFGSGEKLEYLSEQGSNSLGCASDTDWDSPKMVPKERVLMSRRTYLSNSPMRSDEKEDSDDYERKSEKDTKGAWPLQRTADREIGLVSEQRVENWVSRYTNIEKDMNMYDSDSSSTTPYGNTIGIGTARPRANFEHRRDERDAFAGYSGHSMAVSDRKRVPNIPYPSERPSSSNSDLFYSHQEAIRNYENPTRVNAMEGLDPTRAELLRRLDELKDQIIKSCDVTDRSPIDPYYGRVPYNVSRESSTRNPQQMLGPRFFEPGNGTFPLTGRHQRNSEDFLHPLRHILKGVPSYEDPKKFHYPPSHQYPPQLPDEQYSESSMDFRSSLYHDDNPASIGWKSSDPQRIDCFPPQDVFPHSRRPSELDSDVDGFSKVQTRNIAVLPRRGKFCDAIAGGAPFILCSSCLELLRLPRKLYKLEKDWKKLQCGACSIVITVTVENKRLVISVPAENKVNEVSPGDGFPERSSADATNSLENPDSFSNNLIDTKQNKPSEDQNLSFGDSENQGPTSSFISSKEEEETPDSISVLKDLSKPSDEPSKDFPPQLNPDEHSNHEASKHREESKIEQNSVIDAFGPSELDVSFEDYSNTQVSQDSVEISKEEEEEDQNKIREESDPSFSDLNKNDLRDFSRSSEIVGTGKPHVYVNGQPLPAHVVKKAEKRAGPILPGDYWYDYQAGFWGVMGHPCLGIIPPFIDEFTYPMPRNCSAGNTGVYVNGRELHKMDLDLLSHRGLPSVRDKFYKVDISGRVVDEDSGEQIHFLGKLAPTIEKVKHGFGMKVPRSLK